MTWALKRQITYLFILLLFLGGIGYLVARPYLNREPTCTDYKQNGDETGVDCGGSCIRACVFEVDELSVLWARTFQVVPGRYNSVAYIENHNADTAIYKINYKFRFADKDNLYIGKRDGSAYIPPSGRFAIFEPAIDFGDAVPVYTTFEFTEAPVWVKVPTEKINQLKIFVSNINLEGEGTSPHLSATVKNNSLFTVPNINVIAILYDEVGNAISASKTNLPLLEGESSAQINFTWPEPFSRKVVAKEIIPIFNIFDVSLE